MHEHPRCDFASLLQEPFRTASDLGYRMPAEWEPCNRVWVCNPHNPQTWPGCFDQARQQFDDILNELRKFVTVTSTQELDIDTEDSWIRDYGPIFVVNTRGDLACHDFIFNCWGRKYDSYENDDVVAQHIATKLGIPIWIHDMVLEGGSIDVNGRGTAMTTCQCLLNENRNPDLSRGQIEKVLRKTLGISHLIWLPGALEADDTDGHVDTAARFITSDTIVAARVAQSQPEHDVLEMNWQVLKHARDECGNQLNLIELPLPEPMFYEYPPDRFDSGGRLRLPATYANFLIANTAVFVPVFGQPTDDKALRCLERAMPNYQIIPVRCEYLIVGLGGIHCLTVQHPQ